MIKAQIAGDFLADGISVRILLETGGGKLLLRAGEDGGTRWEPFEPEAALAGNGPYLTIRLTDEAGRALTDALLRYYEGASDMRTVRSDLLHERGRVDDLIGLIKTVVTAGIATGARQP